MAELIIMALGIMTLDAYAECHYAVSFLLSVASESNMLIVIMLSVLALGLCLTGMATLVIIV